MYMYLQNALPLIIFNGHRRQIELVAHGTHKNKHIKTYCPTYLLTKSI